MYSSRVAEYMQSVSAETGGRECVCACVRECVQCVRGGFVRVSARVSECMSELVGGERYLSVSVCAYACCACDATTPARTHTWVKHRRRIELARAVCHACRLPVCLRAAPNHALPSTHARARAPRRAAPRTCHNDPAQR
jgi:hypothetical protein